MTDNVTLHRPQSGAPRAAVVPDGYFVLDSGAHLYHHFLEVDLGTVTGISSVYGKRDFGRKIRAYLAYYQSGQYEERYSTNKGRVLIVTSGERRLANLK